ncbi:MAG: class B sortase [Bacilli bacterium]|nr:class B sortase [Bacilli bacterium]
MVKKKNNGKWKIFIVLLVSFIIGYGTFFYFFQKSKKDLTPTVKKLIEEKKNIQYSDSNDNKKDVSNYVNYLPEYRKSYGNDDIKARLEIPNLGIDSLIVRSVNNEFYLKNNIHRKYDNLGVPFFDYRNIDLVHSKQLNIYGHNTRNTAYLDSLPFTRLEAYVDFEIFNHYKDVYLSLDEIQFHYEVVAVKIITNEDNEHMKVLFYNDDDFLTHISKMLDHSLYIEKDFHMKATDHFLILQVCHYNPDNSYLLVICQEKSK